MLTSQGVVVATAMAVSGTFILLALRLQKNLMVTQFAGPLPRSCISSDGKRRDKKKKKVHFAEDVVDPTGNSEDFRKLHKINYVNTQNLVPKSKIIGGGREQRPKEAGSSSWGAAPSVKIIRRGREQRLFE